MKNNSKRICALLLAIVMCIGCVVPVFAETAHAVGNASSSSSSSSDCQYANEKGEHVYVKDAAYLTFIRTVDPVCGEEGYDLYECVCGKPVLTNKKVVNNGADHSWSAWEPVKNPTCTDKGQDKRTCSTCGKPDYRDVDALGHDELTNKPAKIVCALGATWKCGRCDYDFVKVAGDCTFELVKFNPAPTCNGEGSADFECSVCHETKQVEVEKMNPVNGAHTWVKVGEFDEGKAPTCAKPGSGNVKCSECGLDAKVVDGYITGKLEGIDVNIAVAAFAATGKHDYSKDVPAVEAGCETGGNTAGKVCSVCGAADPENTSEPREPKGHVYGNLVPAVEDDCEKDKWGMAAHYFCDVCDTYFDSEKKATTEDALKIKPTHTWKDEPSAVIAPTCTTFGWELYACVDCGELGTQEDVGSDVNFEVTGVVKLDKLGHNFDPEKGATVVGAPQIKDCEKDGKITYKCANSWQVNGQTVYCDETKEFIDEATGHQYKPVVTPATCEHKGYTQDICSCGAIDPKGKYDEVSIDKDNHEIDWSKAAVATPPTCTTEGVLLGYCPYCKVDDTQPIKKLSHEYLKKVGETAPNCDNDGHYVMQCVNGCGGTTTIKADDAVLKANKLTESLYNETAHDKLGHNYINFVETIYPDCYANGYDVYDCANDNCNKTIKDYTVAADTYAEAGAADLKYPKTSHGDYSAVVTYPSCAAPSVKGYTTMTCGVCEQHKASGNKLASVVAANATEYSVYSYKTAYTDYDFENHLHHGGNAAVYEDTLYHNAVRYDTPELADEAARAEAKDPNATANGIYRIGTCTKSELRDYYCTACKTQFYVRNVNGEKFGVGEHLDLREDVKATEPSCTGTGTTLGWHCEACGESEKSETIPATGHTLVKQSGSEVGCITDGEKEHYICSVCDGIYLTNDSKSTENVKESDLKIPATGHTFGNVVAEESSSCTVQGTAAHYVCSTCNCKYLTNNVKDADAKTPEELKLPLADHSMKSKPHVDATCTTEGYTYYWCENCTYEIVKEYERENGHNYGELVKANEAQCGKDGNIAYYFCEDCGHYFDSDKKKDLGNDKDSTVLPATGKHVHEFKDKDGKVISSVEFTDSCKDVIVDANGKVVDKFCKWCEKVIVDTHKNTSTNTVAPTCVEYGYTAKLCNDCGVLLEKTDMVDPKNPDHEDKSKFAWVVLPGDEAGVFEEGKKSYVCSDCGYVEKTEKIPAKGGIVFSYEIDNAIKSGADFVNGGKIKLTIKYNAVNANLTSIFLNLNYNKDVLAYVSGEHLCEIYDGDDNIIFKESAIGGNIPGTLTASARTYGFTDTDRTNKTLNGEGIFAIVYFDIKDEATIDKMFDFSVVTEGNSRSEVLDENFNSLDADSIVYGEVAAKPIKALGDVLVDGVLTSADVNKLIDIAFSQADNYLAAADIDQDGDVDSDDYDYLMSVVLGDMSVADMWKKNDRNLPAEA